MEYVDEDGNLIEGGKEQLIYVDRKGRAVSERSAKKLLDSGRYIDSRTLYGGGAVRKPVKKLSLAEEAKLQQEELIRSMQLRFAEAKIKPEQQPDLDLIEADAYDEAPSQQEQQKLMKELNDKKRRLEQQKQAAGQQDKQRQMNLEQQKHYQEYLEYKRQKQQQQEMKRQQILNEEVFKLESLMQQQQKTQRSGEHRHLAQHYEKSPTRQPSNSYKPHYKNVEKSPTRRPPKEFSGNRLDQSTSQLKPFPNQNAYYKWI